MSKLDKLASLVPMEEIEQSAQQQIYEALSLPFLKKLAIMPDVHAGYDLPIGGVALLDGFVSPGFIGFDIGCGVCHIALEEDYRVLSTKEYQFVYQDILRTIPTGFAAHKHSKDYLPKFESAVLNKQCRDRVRDRVDFQLGTLGGGNHFIELGYNRAEKLCVTIHSGSRNVGHTIGGAYMKMGRFFELNSALGQAYLHDMNYALEWALANRLHMMRRILECIGVSNKNITVLLKDVINENHNHAIVTSEGVLHRKGATPADEGQLGIIPANMRDGVYITRGLGNSTYLSSASHGCGRLMGRNVAKKTLDYGAFVESMDGIVCSTDRSILDEAPAAYKDVNYVIKAQEGITVEIVDFIKPLVNIKASEGVS